MVVPKKIINFLNKNKVKYEILKHKTVYTAFDKAATLKINPKIIGKTLVLKLDKNPVLILIPANKKLDKQKLKKTTKAKKIIFLKEVWMKKNLKGIKIGAVPPFGSLWNVKTFFDRNLIKEPKILINSGSYNFSIKINPKELKKVISDLIIGNFSQSRK